MDEDDKPKMLLLYCIIHSESLVSKKVYFLLIEVLNKFLNASMLSNLLSNMSFFKKILERKIEKI